MKKQLLLFAFSLLSVVLCSQSAVPMAFEDWKTTSGTQNLYYKNTQRVDGTDTYMAGATKNANGDLDILIVKYNSGGHIVWIQQYAGSAGSMDFAADIQISGSYVYITGAVTTNTTTMLTDFITMKLDKATGVIQWTSTYDGPAGSGDAGKAMYIDAATSSVWVTGASYNSTPNTDVVTIKYNSSGTQQFVKTYNSSANRDDAGVFIRPGGTNQMIVAGVCQQTITSNYKNVVLTYSMSTGATISSTTGTATATSLANSITAFAVDNFGLAVYLAGSRTIGGQGENFYVQKITLSSSGATVAWTYQYNSPNNLDDIPRAIDIDASNNVYISGYSAHASQGKNVVLMKLNSSGVNQWTQFSAFNGDEEIADLALDASSNVYVTGYKTSSEFGDKNYYTAKYSNAGTKQWEIESDGVSKNDVATNIAIDSLNNVIITGQSETVNTGEYSFLTVRYVQQDVKDPVDLLGQPTNRNFGYHQNKGQVRNDTGGVASSALYYTHNQYPKIYIEKNAYDYVFSKTDTVEAVLDTIERIRVFFSESNSNITPRGYKPKTYPLNYFLGHLSEPVTNLKGQDRVVTQNIYANIDLHYYSNSNGFKYYFVVKPGGRPQDIRLYISGAITTSIVANDLFIDGQLGDITLKQPYAYMIDAAGSTTTLSAVTWTNTSGVYRITTPTYTNTQSLVYVVETANPATPMGTTANLEYSTYYGKGESVIFNDIRVASNGDRYVVGHADGPTFPIVNSTTTYKAGRDAVLLKYSVIKDSLVYALCYGGNGDEFGNSVDLNSLGEVFIAGRTNSSGSTGIPTYTISGASNQASNGMSIAPSGADPNDGFIARFSPFGNVLTWGRYYGGSMEDGINSIFIDNSNNLHYTGFARSNNITMGPSAAQASLSVSSGTNVTAQVDAIVGKFNQACTLVYSTYLGGGNSPYASTRDEGRDITVDGSGNAIVVGTTDASNFPVNNATGTSNANTFYDASFGGYRDGFIARYSPSGTKQFGSYFGGAGLYNINEITRVNYNSVKDEIYFAGQSNDTVAFPYVILSGAFNLKRKAPNAAFIASMSSNFTKQWCTNYGKAASNFSVTGLGSDNAGIIYLSGQAKTNTLSYPVTPPIYTVYNDSIRNGDDGFVTIFTPQKDLFHAHYFGGSGNDYINNAYVGANNKLYVVGNTGSTTDFPIAYDNINIQHVDTSYGGGQYDGFISRFDMGEIQVISVKETSQADYLLSVYPNPSTSGFVLEMKDDGFKNVQAKVYNITGQVVVEQKITQSLTKFYCESWASGVYLINVNADGKLKTFKLIKN